MSRAELWRLLVLASLVAAWTFSSSGNRTWEWDTEKKTTPLVILPNIELCYSEEPKERATRIRPHFLLLWFLHCTLQLIVKILEWFFCVSFPSQSCEYHVSVM
jgi:hypothetical protein